MALNLGKKIYYFNWINQQPDIDRIYLYAKDPYQAKYQFLINNVKITGLKKFNEPKAFLKYSNNMDDIKILKNAIQIRNIKY